MTVRRWLLLALLIVGAGPAAAQQVAVDRGVRFGGLWCFPLVSDTATFVYLPSEARLATDRNGLPQFSLVRYAALSTDTASSASGTRAARGGGVLHFLVEYQTPAAAIRAADEAIKEAYGDSAAVRGPLVFDEARFTVTSSILGGAADSGRAVLKAGQAPLLEGNRLALSFELTPEATTLLSRSLEMETPDVSLVFELGFSGLSDAYQAEMDVDWSAVQRSFHAEAGGSVYFIGADVERRFDELRRDNAIRLRTQGESAPTEALVQIAYDRLLKMLFSPVELADVPPETRGGLMSALGEALSPRNLSRMARGTTGFGLYAGFRMTELRLSGHSTLSFNHRATVKRHATLVFNAGPMLQRYGNDPRFVRSVSLEDPGFQQRDVYIAVDGELLPEFARAINSATVTLRKRHDDGTESVGQVLLDGAAFKTGDPRPRLSYGWAADTSRLGWLAYEYRVQWNFVGGAMLSTEWRPADAAMINLHTPFARRRIEVVGDLPALEQRGVRAVEVRLSYPFFGERRQEQRIVRPASPPREPVTFEITLPRDTLAYDYTVAWHLDDNRRLTTSGRDEGGLVFVDDLPTDALGHGAPGANGGR